MIRQTIFGSLALILAIVLIGCAPDMNPIEPASPDLEREVVLDGPESMAKVKVAIMEFTETGDWIWNYTADTNETYASAGTTESVEGYPGMGNGRQFDSTETIVIDEPLMEQTAIGLDVGFAVRFNSFNGPCNIIGQGTTWSNGSWAIGTYTGNEIMLSFLVEGQNYAFWAPVAMNEDQWYRVRVKWNGSDLTPGENGRCWIWIDGVQVGRSNGVAPSTTFAGDLVLGGHALTDWVPQDGSFDGVIDEARIKLQTE